MELKRAIKEFEEQMEELDKVPELTILDDMREALKVAIPALRREVELEEQGLNGVLDLLRKADRQDLIEQISHLQTFDGGNGVLIRLNDVIKVLEGEKI